VPFNAKPLSWADPTQEQGPDNKRNEKRGEPIGRNRGLIWRKRKTSKRVPTTSLDLEQQWIIKGAKVCKAGIWWHAPSQCEKN